MNTINPQNVWDSINQDPKFLAEPEYARLVLKPFIQALPEVLADLLELPANYENVVRAKYAFLQYCSENNYITAAVESTPESALGPFDRSFLKEMLERMFAELVELLGSVLESAPDFLAAQGVTDVEVMTSSELGLNAEVLELYNAGQLTIGQLAVMQPMIIVNNS